MGALEGFRVVELGMWAAGPGAGGVLADWGADVVKIEPPGGDPMRVLYSAMAGSSERRCPPFDLLNRGKRSVAVDLSTEEGVKVAERLIAGADVFLTNMRPKFLRRVGLDPERLTERYPRLVYALLTGYGLTGPDRDAPGYDVAAFSARSGASARSTPPGQPPVALVTGMGDLMTGMTTAGAVSAALLQRERTGKGQVVSTSLLRTGAYAVGLQIATRAGLGRLAPPPGRTAAVNPMFNSYRAGDGHWFWLIGAEAERHWPDLLAAAKDPRLEDERFATTRGRRTNAEELVTILDDVFASRDRAQWARDFDEHDVWWAPVNSVEDLLEDPQAIAAGVFVDMPGGDGVLRSVATPVDFGADEIPMQAAPAIGADTDAVLRELGVEDTELDRLREAGVIRSAEAPELVQEGGR
ncbi:MAG TPA: CaiB/BaiF CoA-transferase family protein [Pseudonocardia sp.]|jgi:crotonobetainyl-CoA:carnitine CoA-transferase CaiB-like acyl-CoA transferase|nr:CaiB/BaiF CoA-transferase family protein [Pseudonocardia sp.]